MPGDRGKRNTEKHSLRHGHEGSTRQEAIVVATRSGVNEWTAAKLREAENGEAETNGWQWGAEKEGEEGRKDVQ